MTTDTSLAQVESVGRAIYGAITSANPEAFHPAYERDREVWDDAKSAMAAFTGCSPLNALGSLVNALHEDPTL